MTNPEENVHETTAVIDNGSFGTRTIRFETGRLAQQAAGSVVAYLDDDTMLLSATTASKHPKEHFDFFPLTVDVEERMYAARQDPRLVLPPRRPPEHRRDPHLPSDRPSAAPVVRRRPAQRDPDRRHRAVARPAGPLRRARDQRGVRVHAARRACRSPARSAACASPCIERPVGGVPDSTRSLQRAVFDMVVAGRVVGDGPNERCRDHDGRGRGHHEHRRADRGRRARRPPRPSSRRASRRRSRSSAPLCIAQQQLADVAAKPTGSSRSSPPTRPTCSTRSPRRRPTTSPGAHRSPTSTSARPASTRSRPRSWSKLGAAVRGPREGDRRGVPVGDQEARAPPHPAPTRSASTVAGSPTSGRCRPRSRSSRGCTARRCSSAARPRSWASPR